MERTADAARQGVAVTGSPTDIKQGAETDSQRRPKTSKLGAKHWVRVAARARATAAGYALIGGFAGGSCGLALWAVLRLVEIFRAGSPAFAAALWFIALLYSLVGILAGALMGGVVGACLSLRRAIVDEGEVRHIATALERAIMRRIEAAADETQGDARARPSYSDATLPASEVVALAEHIIRDNGDSSSDDHRGARGRLASATEQLLLRHYDALFLDDLRAVGNDSVVTLSQVKQWAAEKVEAAIRSHLNAYARGVCLGTLLTMLLIFAIPVMIALAH